MCGVAALIIFVRVVVVIRLFWLIIREDKWLIILGLLLPVACSVGLNARHVLVNAIVERVALGLTPC